MYRRLSDIQAIGGEADCCGGGDDDDDGEEV